MLYRYPLEPSRKKKNGVWIKVSEWISNVVRKEQEKECGGKGEMKAKLKVTFFLRKIKTKSLSSAEINSDNELR